MTPSDEARFRRLIAGFITDCGLSPPLWLILTAANQSVSVAHYLADGSVVPVCDHVVDGGFAAPVVIAALSPSGAGRSARITVEAPARPTMQ